MILDPAIAAKDGLWVFRCLVTILFDEPKQTPAGAVGSFARIYGITAPSYAQAAAVMEELAGRAVDDQGQPVGPEEGWLEELELAVMDPEDVLPEAASAAVMEKPGLHFVSDPILFDEDGEEL